MIGGRPGEGNTDAADTMAVDTTPATAADNSNIFNHPPPPAAARPPVNVCAAPPDIAAYWLELPAALKAK